MKSLKIIKHSEPGKLPWESTLRTVNVLADMELNNMLTEGQGGLQRVRSFEHQFRHVLVYRVLPWILSPGLLPG